MFVASLLHLYRLYFACDIVLVTVSHSVITFNLFRVTFCALALFTLDRPVAVCLRMVVPLYISTRLKHLAYLRLVHRRLLIAKLEFHELRSWRKRHLSLHVPSVCL